MSRKKPQLDPEVTIKKQVAQIRKYEDLIDEEAREALLDEEFNPDQR